MKTHLRLGASISSTIQHFSDSIVLLDDAHEMAQLNFVSKGAMIVSSTDGNWIVPSAGALWLVPNVRHRIRMVGQVRLQTVWIDPAMASGLPEKSCVLAVSRLFREIFSAVVDAPAKVIPTRRRLLLTELLLEEICAQPEPLFDLPAPGDPRLAAICVHIQQHLDDTKTLGSWAKDLDCDERTLHRLFIQEVGMSFVQWRQQAKLLAALEWLAQGRPILRIALDLGYQSQSAFTAMFRRTLGVPPSAFFKATSTGVSALSPASAPAPTAPDVLRAGAV